MRLQLDHLPDAPARVAPAPIAPLRFSTDALPRAAQFDAWQARCGTMVSFSPADPGAGFLANNDLWALGGMLASSVTVPAGRFRRGAAAIRRDGIDHWQLAVARRGTTALSTRHAACRVPPGQPMLFSLAEPFEGERTDTDWAVLFLSRDTFHDLAPILDAARGIALDGPRGLLLGDFVLALHQRLPTMAEADLPSVAAATRAMLAACVPAAGTHAPVPPGMVHLARAERARRAVHANLGSTRLNADMLCRLVGVSRSQLYRMFERHGGVARYVLAQRLAAAHAALSDPAERRTIVAIAESLAFADASGFSRAFRAAFGCTPRQVRDAAGSGVAMPPVQRATFAANAMDLPGLLRRI